MRALPWIAALAAAVACSSANESPGPRFAPLGGEAVRDARTGLLWRARDSGRELSWPEAERHCRGLGGGSGGARWRLPSIEELASLYDTSMEQPCGESAICRVDPAIQLSSPYQWSATAPEPDRRFYYDFLFGSRLSPLIRPVLTRRTLCTRGAQDEGERRRRGER
jgi:hypothetical protein